MKNHESHSISYQNLSKTPLENSTNYHSKTLNQPLVESSPNHFHTSPNFVNPKEIHISLNPRFGTTVKEKESLDLNFLTNKQRVSEILKTDYNIKPKEVFVSFVSPKTLKNNEKKDGEMALLRDHLLNNSVIGAFKKLIKATFYRKLSDLKPEQRALFGDLADFRENEEKGKSLSTPFRAFLEKIVFNPYKKAKMIWNFLIFMYFLLLFLFIPFELSFAAWIDPKPTFFFYMIALIVLSLDLAVTLNTAIFIKGCQVTERTLILKNYFKQSFLRDLGGFVALIYALGINNYRDPISQCPKMLIFIKFPHFLTLYYEIL